MPLRGLAKSKNFTLGPTAPMKTFTENVHNQTNNFNNRINSQKTHNLTNVLQNEKLYKYESQIKKEKELLVMNMRMVPKLLVHLIWL